MRLVGPPGDTGVANMVAALNRVNSVEHDFISPSEMKIWHSHFQIVGQPANAANGPLFCADGAPDGGADARGTTMLGINVAHFCSDFGTPTGKLNLTY